MKNRMCYQIGCAIQMLTESGGVSVSLRIPYAGQTRDRDRKLPTHPVTEYLHFHISVKAGQNQRHSHSARFGVKLLWSCLPSPRAPSLRISSVNSGFCMYSCTNSWKFFIRTSSRSYCKTSTNNMNKSNQLTHRQHGRETTQYLLCQ